MPQLSPLFWMSSSVMVVFLLVSMMMVFYLKSVSFCEVNEYKVYLMNWCW
uniref:ATP synthase F0 subunit 8 n=1 Tax=Austrarchaea aleenae TaxID=1028690 RepID=H2E3Q6_9ARAC|nr:ATP synthase F0 subunit 8 [Austrarchaea aleenae]AEX88818.1 ATP synthase F0 subunit 8 [Austrarchaea aleenae]AEX88821.1 ATP synthase F0 subunit 8 [Austrarchaea aleenae]